MHLDDEIAELRVRVRVLAAGLGLDQTFRIPEEVQAQAQAGHTVLAVRELRRSAPGRLRLVDAKRMVDAMAEKDHEP